MKKVLIGTLVLVLTVVMVLFFTSHGSDHKKEVGEGDITLYYISVDGTSFCEIPYQFSQPGRPEQMAKEVLNQLKQVPESEECQPSIPESVVWSDLKLEDLNLIIDFTSSYNKLTNVKEIFLRASVVKSLVQIDGVNTVEFRLNGTPLLNAEAQPVGAMTADWFIDDSNANWGVTQDEIITLFYVNKTGDGLVGEDTRITVKNNIPKEQEIIERLIEGSTKKGHYLAIPKGTEVLSTVTKNGTCYVDFNEHFLDPMENVSPVMTVFSVVNSLAELPNVTKVQFTINGEKVKTFRDSFALDVPFERDLDLLDQENDESIEEYSIAIEYE